MMVAFFYWLMNLMEQSWFVQATWLTGLVVMFLMAATTGWKLKLLIVLLLVIAALSITTICIFHAHLWPAVVYTMLVIIVSLGLFFSKSTAH